MSQEYTPVEWVDETPTQIGTVINKARLDQMQSAHHYADGFEEVDSIPTDDPGVDYHKVVYCTADSSFYRWDGSQWTKDVDDDTKALLQQEIQRATDAEGAIAQDLSDHENDHTNPHQVTKAQVGLGNVDNTSDIAKPISNATQAALQDITAKIPAQASPSNQLADKDFVNSSIATNTANFLGTYDAESDLGFASATVDTWTDPPSSSVESDVGSAISTKLSALGKTATNNDYVFVSVDQSATVGTNWYWRFKFNGSAWVYEFTLNNSSFTADQWAAINSGITVGIVSSIGDKVDKLSTKPTAGTYTKVTINSEGQVTAGNTLAATDIPSLDWSKITSGKPTTLAGYGITDAKIVNGVITLGSNTITVNNATLTIQKNGTTVKTFTANASSNVTANITVPTKVSELTNDSGFITSLPKITRYITTTDTVSGSSNVSIAFSGTNKNPNNNTYFTNTTTAITVVKEGVYLIMGQMYGKVSTPTRIQLSIKVGNSEEKFLSMAYFPVANINMSVNLIGTFTASANTAYTLQLWAENGTFTTSNNAEACVFEMVKII